MTRETKIGLLVGLAFIIVIGILLSDHINAAGDPLRADNKEIFSSVQRGINTPLSQPQPTDTVVQVKPVVPRNPVRTENEVEPRQTAGTTVIRIGPGTDPSQVAPPPAVHQPQQTQVVQGPAQGNDGSEQTGGQVATNDRQATPEPPATTTGNSRVDHLVNTARRNNEELVTPGGQGVGVSVPKPPDFQVRPEGRQVVAEENDTVSKFASKYMGANTKANREAIIKANPSVGADGSKVFAGKTYTIPAAVAGAGQPGTGGGNQTVVQAQPPVRLSPQAVTPAPAPAPGSNVTLYTVTDKDTLWKIAYEQLGSGARYPEIVELNKDVLKGKEAVRAGMRLKLPAKAVATNN